MPSGSKLPPGPLTRALGAQLHAISQEKGISQASIGRTHVGTPMYISQSNISRFFAGAKGIDVDQLAGLCETLGVDVIEQIEAAERSTLVAESRRQDDYDRVAKKRMRDRGDGDEYF
jgi:transcriptional regulator with XRE-family HTH domain